MSCKSLTWFSSDSSLIFFTSHLLATMMRGCREQDTSVTLQRITLSNHFYSSSERPVTWLKSDLVGEQWSDVVEELQLFLQGVTALLGYVHDVKNRRSQVSQSRDGLHLDGVPVLQGVVQDTGGVHHLHTRETCRLYMDYRSMYTGPTFIQSNLWQFSL